MTTEPDLKPFSYVVLALVGDGGASPHDIAGSMGRSRIYWASAPSQWYAEPKRLAELGYLEARSEPGKTRPRTVYTLTRTGRRALVDWLAQPSVFPRIQNEAAIRLLAGDMIDDTAIVASLRGMLPEIEELEATLAEVVERAATVPHRARYLLLSHAWARRMLEMHRAWIAEVEAALATPQRPAPRPRPPAPKRPGARRRGAT